jgi:hypothetical protein
LRIVTASYVYHDVGRGWEVHALMLIWLVAVVAGAKVRGQIVDPPAHHIGVGDLAAAIVRRGDHPRNDVRRTAEGTPVAAGHSATNATWPNCGATLGYPALVTSTPNCDGEEQPTDVHPDLDTLVRRSESLGHEDNRHHFFTVLNGGRAGTGCPARHVRHFHYRDGIVHPDSRQAIRYYECGWDTRCCRARQTVFGVVDKVLPQ